MDQSALSFSIKPLSAHTGAEIRGIDLSRPLDEPARAALNQVFVDHAVLCIRDQKLSAPQFLEAMKIFGEIFPQHNSRFAVPECPAIHYISNQDKLEDGKRLHPGRGLPHRSFERRGAAEGEGEPARGQAAEHRRRHAVRQPATRPISALPDATKKRIDGLQAKHVYQSKYSERKLPKLPGDKEDRDRRGAASAGAHPSRAAAARRSTSIRSGSRRS